MIHTRRQQFDISVNDTKEIIFTGLKLVLRRKEVRSLSQTQYIARLRLLPNRTSFPGFRSIRARLAWVTHTRPDICCAVSLLAQTTANTFNSGCTKSANWIIVHLKRTPNLQLRFSSWINPPCECLFMWMLASTTPKITDHNSVTSSYSQTNRIAVRLYTLHHAIANASSAQALQLRHLHSSWDSVLLS